MLRCSRPKRHLGFTLIELLVVIVILGVLASIAAMNVRINLVKSRDAARKADLNSVQNALEIYQNDHGVYPPANDGNITDDLDEAKPWGTALEDSKGTIYMFKLPVDPTGNPGYCYEVEVSRQDYRLCARLENSNDQNCITQDCLNTASCNGLEYNYCTRNSIVQEAGLNPTPTPPMPCRNGQDGYGTHACYGGTCHLIMICVPECQTRYFDNQCFGQCGSPGSPLNNYGTSNPTDCPSSHLYW